MNGQKKWGPYNQISYTYCCECGAHTEVCGFDQNRWAAHVKSHCMDKNGRVRNHLPSQNYKTQSVVLAGYVQVCMSCCACGHVFACVMSVLWVGKWSLLTQTTLWDTHQVSPSGFPLRTSSKPPKKETRINLYGSQHHGQLYLPFFLLSLNSSSVLKCLNSFCIYNLMC